MNAVILAGGKGTRLRPLTLNTPKPIVPILTRPFLSLQIELLKKTGIDNIVLSLSYQPRRIEELFGDGSALGVKIHYAMEPEPLGTAGAVKNAESLLAGRTIVFNGDVLSDLDLKAVLKQHEETGAKATIVLTPVENPTADVELRLPFPGPPRSGPAEVIVERYEHAVLQSWRQEFQHRLRARVHVTVDIGQGDVARWRAGRKIEKRLMIVAFYHGVALAGNAGLFARVLKYIDSTGHGACLPFRMIV